MKEQRWKAREFLKNASRKEYEAAVFEAHLTPMQEEVLHCCITMGMTVCKAAMVLHCSEATIKKLIGTAYDKISQVLS